MVQIDTSASMDSFRTFIMVSTCSSFAPQSYADDTEVFPEREEDLGSAMRWANESQFSEMLS